MKASTPVAVIVALLVPLAVGPAAAEHRSKVMPSQSEFLMELKPGQWMRVKGQVQRDLSVLCTEAKIMSGDFLDDDWSVTGVVRGIDPNKQEIAIHRYAVRLKDRAEFESADESFKEFGDVKPGMFVQVEGTYLKDGTFL